MSGQVALPLAPQLQIVTVPSVQVATIRNAVLLQADANALPLGGLVVDLTVTSPMYGAGIEYDEGGDVTAAEWERGLQLWLADLYRVTKSSGRLAVNVPMDMAIGAPLVGRSKLSRPTYYQVVNAALAVGWLYAHTITWDKNHHKKGNRGLGSVGSSARPYPIDPTEAIILFSKGEWGPSSSRPDDITPEEWQEYSHGPWRFPGLPRRKGGHPAAFPEELPRRCIRYLSRAGDVVLDPFVGSGTTVAVAVAEGRFGIGCDRSAAYLADAYQRVARVPGRLPTGRCGTCRVPVSGGRSHQVYCSKACKQKAYRQRRQSA